MLKALSTGLLGGSYYSLLFLVAGLDRARFEPVVEFARDFLIPRFEAGGTRAILRFSTMPVLLARQRSCTSTTASSATFPALPKTAASIR